LLRFCELDGSGTIPTKSIGLLLSTVKLHKKLLKKLKFFYLTFWRKYGIIYIVRGRENDSLPLQVPFRNGCNFTRTLQELTKVLQKFYLDLVDKSSEIWYNIYSERERERLNHLLNTPIFNALSGRK
jgi:hypothetical protein